MQNDNKSLNNVENQKSYLFSRTMQIDTFTFYLKQNAIVIMILSWSVIKMINKKTI